MIVERDIFSGQYHVFNESNEIVFSSLFESKAIEYAMKYDK